MGSTIKLFVMLVTIMLILSNVWFFMPKVSQLAQSIFANSTDSSNSSTANSTDFSTMIQSAFTIESILPIIIVAGVIITMIMKINKKGGDIGLPEFPRVYSDEEEPESEKEIWYSCPYCTLTVKFDADGKCDNCGAPMKLTDGH